MHYIIVDLEATCWESRDGKRNEIIEIGATSVDEQLNIVGEFCEFIKPKINPELSNFCIQLTSIKQSDIDKALPFPESLKLFLDWIKSFSEDYLLCSWGHYDRVQFKNDCELHGLNYEWSNQHISLKHQYGKIKKLKRPPGMKRALKVEGIPLKGTHHRGIDDAKNITKIFQKYYRDWDFQPNVEKDSPSSYVGP